MKPSLVNYAQWQLRRLGELLDVASGQVDPRDPSYQHLPHVGGENIESDTGRLFNLRSAGELGLISGKYVFAEEDVLYSKIRPALNKVVTPDFSGICSADIYPLRPKPGALDRRFLAYLLRHKDFLAYAEKHSTRTNIPKLNRESLLSYEIRVPSKDEQIRISSILDKADAIRRKRKEALALTEDLLRSTFLEMFGDPVTNPKGWPQKTFDDVCAKMQYGTAAKANTESKGIAVLRMNNLSFSGLIDTSDLKWVVLDDKEKESLLLRDGDVLFNRTNSLELVGKTAVWRGSFPAVFAGYLIRLKLREEMVLPDYVSGMLNSGVGKRLLLTIAKTSVNMANISASDLGRQKILTPPLDIQRSFARVVQEISSLRTKLLEGVRESDALFASLLDRAFRGELTAPPSRTAGQLPLF